MYYKLLTWICIFLIALPSEAQQANLLGQWFDDDLIGSNAHDNTYNEIWGIVVDGREFAVIGSTAGTHMIDITNPALPVQTNFIEGAVSGGQIIHRDYHDYDGYLYAVADEGLSTLQIIDIGNVPNSAPVVYESSNLIRRAHNIFIDEESGLLYAFATRGDFDGGNGQAMRIFNLTDPINPVFVAEYNGFDEHDIGHVHDGYVRNGMAFLNCGGDGLYIVDFTDPLDPVLLSLIEDYPDKAYNHSGWLTDDGEYYYMADEAHGMKLKTVAVENLCEAEVKGVFDAEVTNPMLIPHNQIVACDYLYCSYYYDGLQVFDISDRENPQKVLEYDTYPEADGQEYKGAWGVFPFLPSGNILVSDMQTGLYVFEGVGDGCHSSKEIRALSDPCAVVQSTGILDQPNTSFNSMYPQPVTSGNVLTVELKESHIGNLDIELFSIDGRTVQSWHGKSASNQNLQLEINSGILSGLYLISVRNEEATLSQILEILSK